MSHRRPAALALLWTVSLACAGAQRAPTPEERSEPGLLLWAVTAPDAPGTVHLLGSVHLREADNFELDPAVMAALGASEALALEADVSDQASGAVAAAELGILPIGQQSLKDLISESTWESLNQRLDQLGVPRLTFRQLRPWLAAITLIALEFQKKGYSPDTGVDSLMRQQAEALGLELRFLETVEEQLQLIAGLDAELQEAWLLDAIRATDPETDVDDFAMIFEAYAEADLKKIEALSLVPLAPYPGLRQRLFDDRNRSFVQALQSMLQEGGTFMMVVGAGHLVGKHGMLQMLRDAGYRLQRTTARGRVQPRPEKMAVGS